MLLARLQRQRETGFAVDVDCDDTNAAIKLWEKAYNKTENNYTKASIINRLGGLYVETKQFEKYLNKKLD